MDLQLFSYWRSSASYRVRIALALKGLQAEYHGVHLAQDQQFSESYAAAAASRLVPLLRVSAPAAADQPQDSHALTQSLAIIEYLEEAHPQPPLLPADAVGRARVRSLALDIACEIHPLNNLRVLRYLDRELKLDADTRQRWYRHWVESGLSVVEQRLLQQPGSFCHGEQPTMADCVLVPQIFNARRFDCRLDHVPQVMRVFERCMQLPAFSHTQPSACPDAE